MLGGIFGKAADFLDRRFLLGLLLPCLAFTAAVSSLVITSYGWNAADTAWRALSGSQRWLIAAGLTVVVFFVASVLGAHINWLIGIWEGYWRPQWMQKPGVWLQRRRYASLERLDPAVCDEDQGDDDEEDGAGDTRRLWARTRIYREFPSNPDNFLPTRLGNALLAAESYSSERYGLDGVLFWRACTWCYPMQCA